MLNSGKRTGTPSNIMDVIWRSWAKTCDTACAWMNFGNGSWPTAFMSVPPACTVTGTRSRCAAA
jgi:hypothetical protein